MTNNYHGYDMLHDKLLNQIFPSLPKSKNAKKRMERDGFPPAVKISERIRARHLGSVRAYLEKQIREAKERAQPFPARD